jgi:hypothetical protein
VAIWNILVRRHATRQIAKIKFIHNWLSAIVKRKGKAIPVRGRCETPRLQHILDSRLTYGGEIVSLTCWLPLPPGRYLVLISVKG